MAGAAGALRLLAGLALLGVGRAGAGADEGLDKAVAELESLVMAQRARLDALEEQAGRLPEGRRLNMIGFQKDKTLYQVVSAPGGVVPTRTNYAVVDDIGSGLEHMWYIVTAVLVFFMQAGFAMLEAGSCRSRNVENVLMKNMLDVILATLGWWIVGWAFAYSGPFDGVYHTSAQHKVSDFVGWHQFAGHHFSIVRSDGQQEPSTDIVRWFSSWAYACVAATIASNGIAERSNFVGYIVFGMCFSFLIFPTVVAATWGGGFLSDMNNTGFIDFAGSGVVHLAAGTSALVGALIAGPRSGRFEGQSGGSRVKEIPPEFAPHSPILVVLGTLILWFGWYGLVFGRSMDMHTLERGMLAAHAAMNMTIAASTAGILSYALGLALKRTDITLFCNGILAGLVSVSASVASIETGTAFGVGAGGAFMYVVCSCILKSAKIDDPMDSFAVHGACGLWGLFAAAFFDWGTGFKQFHGYNGFRCMLNIGGNQGCVDGNNDDAIGANFAAMGSIFGWVGLLTAVVFANLMMSRCLRDDREQGWDETDHVPAKGYDLEDVLPKTSL